MVVMYMHAPGEASNDLPPLTGSLRFVLWASAAATLVLGIFPQIVLDFAGESAVLIR